jgi:hypothetical protein
MRLAVLALAFAAAGAAGAQPTAVPTPAGAGAVAPSDLSAVRPGLPDERANPTVALGAAPPAPAPLAATGTAAPAPTPAPVDEPSRSEPNTGAAPAAAGSVHGKPGVSRPVSVTRAPLYTVLAFEKGTSLTLRRPDGTTVSFPLAKKSDVAAGVGPGSSVTVRTKTQGGKKVVTQVRLAGDAPVLTNVN